MNISGLMGNSETRVIDAVQRAFNVMAEFSRPIGTALKKGLEGRAACPIGAIDDHLLKDIGFTRLGLREATLHDRNEMPRAT